MRFFLWDFARRVRVFVLTEVLVDDRYWSMHFDARPAVAAELARVLKIDERIIRSSTFKLEKSMRLGIKRDDPITMSGLF